MVSTYKYPLIYPAYHQWFFFIIGNGSSNLQLSPTLIKQLSNIMKKNILFLKITKDVIKEKDYQKSYFKILIKFPRIWSISHFSVMKR
jgi:hypothetical protein